jgi:ribose transport system ATP-binding protein
MATASASRVRADGETGPGATTRELGSGTSASATTTGQPAPLLRVRDVVKQFVGVRALDDVSFSVEAGEVHVLFGENGAGKSTLINTIAGALQPDSGTIELGGRVLELNSVHEARGRGIAAVFQEFSLAPDLTIGENLFLGAEPLRGIFLNKARAHSMAKQALEKLGFDLDCRRLVSTLTRGEQQMVEITKALLVEPKVLILDEPTASLTENETVQLFKVVRQLQASGVGIIYITHRIAEIAAIGNRVTVLRDGHAIATLDISEASENRLVELMTGRQVGQFFPVVKHAPGETVLSAVDLETADGRVRGASFTVRAGEIVGLAGLVGCGKSEMGRSCFGLSELVGGVVSFLDQPIRRPTPDAMLARGMVYLPSDRRREGLLLDRPVRENIALPMLAAKSITRGGLVQRSRERSETRELAARVQLKPLDIERAAIQYSGGNQQKIVLARALSGKIKLLILDEPTVGVDVGAKVEIYNLIAQLTEAGAAILLISSDMPEVMNMCRRVYVVSRGLVVSHLEQDEITESRILAGFFSAAEDKS